MNEYYDIPEQLQELIAKLAKASDSDVAIYAEQALQVFLLGLYRENTLSRTEYGELVYSVETLFLEEKVRLSTTPPDRQKTNSVLMRVEEAIELMKKLKLAEPTERKPGVDCDIYLLMNDVGRDFKDGIVGEVEYEFYQIFFERLYGLSGDNCS